MSEKHRYIPISRVRHGMMLATELLDKQGQVLLPLGFVLTEKTITSLLHHDIHQLSVFTEELESQINTEGETSQKRTQRLNIILRHAPFEEPRHSLGELIKKYRLRNIDDVGDLL